MQSESFAERPTVIYAAFTIYLLGILFASMGVYRLWADMLKPRWVSRALLPGTVVSEMAYIFGCLITGGEVRRAKLMGSAPPPAKRGKSSQGSEAEAEPTTEAEPKLRIAGPIIAAFTSILACGAGIIIAHALLGEPVIAQFAANGDTFFLAGRLKSLPGATGQFWEQLKDQLELLHRMAATWLELDWLNWRVPLFVYLAMCLTIRLAPVRRSLRATLAAVIVMAGIIALIGAVWAQLGGLMDRLWPLVMYVWASLLFLLGASLAIRGGVGLVRALLEKQPSGTRAPS